MTFSETASALRHIADVIDRVVRERGDCSTGAPIALREDVGLGAALMLRYLRDLITLSEREQYDRVTLLVILEAISRDHEMFPHGIGVLVWQAEDPEGDE